MSKFIIILKWLLIVLAVTTLVGVGIYVFLEYKNLKQTQDALLVPSKTDLAPKSDVILSARMDDGRIKLNFTPQDESAPLLAFSLRVSLKADNPIPKPLTIEAPADLVASGWIFPIKKVISESDGTLTIELSGFYAAYKSGGQYAINQPTIFAEIGFSEPPQLGSITLRLDEQVTHFIYIDAISKIETIVAPENN